MTIKAGGQCARSEAKLKTEREILVREEKRNLCCGLWLRREAKRIIIEFIKPIVMCLAVCDPLQKMNKCDSTLLTYMNKGISFFSIAANAATFLSK